MFTVSPRVFLGFSIIARARIQAHYAKGEEGKLFRYYYCLWSKKKTPPRRPKHIKGRCPLPAMNAQRLEDMVFKEIVRYFQFPEMIVEYWQSRADSSKSKALQEQLSKKSTQITREEKKLERWLDLYGDATYSGELLDRKYARVNALPQRMLKHTIQEQPSISTINT